MQLSKDIFDRSLSPLTNISRLLEFADKQRVPESTAMSIASVDQNGNPNNRMVLFKGLLDGGLSFYTNYDSPKSQELSHHPYLSACFFWAPLATQIRIRGSVTKTTRLQSETYFRSRPRVSQLGAWASNQSQVISDYQEFEDKLAFYTKKFENQEVPCPEHWGGFILNPEQVEFWFGIEGRLHYRYLYQIQKDNTWSQVMLSP